MIHVYPPGQCDCIPAIQAFRDEIYARDGVSISETNWQDVYSWHLVFKRGGELLGCLRYTPITHPWAWASGLASSRPGVGAKLAREGIALAARLHHRGFVAATERHGSAEMLRRMGGEIVEEYFDKKYGCEMKLLRFGTPHVAGPIS